MISNRHISGQGQLLAASVIGAVMLAGALYTMDRARINRGKDLYASRRVEMRAALEQAVKQINQIYRDGGCDPVSLDDKIAILRTDGTLDTNVPPTFGRRQLNITVNNHAYTVSIGDSIRLPWIGVDPTVVNVPPLQLNRGTSQDAITEVWTTYNSGAGAPTSQILHQRVIQRAALINTCTNPCSVAGGPECPVAADRAIAYHRISAVSFPTAGGVTPYPGSAWNRRCFDPLNNVRYLGDLDAAPGQAAPDNLVTTTDLFLLKNYLRSGDPTGATPSPSPVPGPAFARVNGVTHVSQVGSGLFPCADFNGDTLVNEQDLHLLEKAMRGYLYWLPTHSLTVAP